MEQASHWSSGIAVSGNVQNTCGCTAWRHGLVENLGAELMVELDGLQGLFQPKCFCDSIRTWEVCKARHLAITL